MTKKDACNRYDYYYKFDSKKKEYDVIHNGVLSRTMSHVIIASENPILHEVLARIDVALVFIVKYIDRLKNFKNIVNYNR